MTLVYNHGQDSLDLPIIHGTLGASAVDIREMAKSGLYTFDPGFCATANCASKITFIDGENGQLYYRGYPIEELAEYSDYVEVCYLLLHGELPTTEQRSIFCERLRHHYLLHDQILSMFKSFRRDSHPMALMIGVTGALSAFYHDQLDITDPVHRETIVLRLIAKIPNIVAQAYRYSRGLPFSYPKKHLSYSENFLHMMFSLPSEEYVVNPVLARALDRIFILHADHEQNASTATVRLAGSSGANPFACLAAGIACLWGPSHGGANEQVLNMLDSIQDASNIQAFIEGVKNKRYRLMGFGHRVYKNMDPRAHIIRRTCHEVLAELGLKEDKKFQLAMKLEKIALEDPYFIERKLYPNVDFYSGIVLSALRIPVPMFTAIFAMARTIGWISQWNEMMADSQQKVGRPRQIYLGQTVRHYLVDGC